MDSYLKHIKLACKGYRSSAKDENLHKKSAESVDLNVVRDKKRRGCFLLCCWYDRWKFNTLELYLTLYKIFSFYLFIKTIVKVIAIKNNKTLLSSLPYDFISNKDEAISIS